MKPKIFIVDDNAVFRNLIKDFLISKGFIITGEATNGQEFLEMYIDENIDIILMDIHMPILNGIETTRIIDQKYSGVFKVIALSQLDDFEYIKGMVEAGAMAYVSKDDIAHKLLEAIDKVMQGKMYYPI